MATCILDRLIQTACRFHLVRGTERRRFVDPLGIPRARWSRWASAETSQELAVCILIEASFTEADRRRWRNIIRVLKTVPTKATFTLISVELG